MSGRFVMGVDESGEVFRARLAFALLVLSTCVAQWVSQNASFAGMSNWLVPDGQTYHDVLRILRTDGIRSMAELLPEQFSGIPVNPLLFAYYYPFYVLMGGAGYVLANLLAFLPVAKRYMLVGIFLTPYFLLSFALPSKDLVVLALFIPFLSLLYRGKYVAALCFAICIFLVRDGAGVVALACILASRFAPESAKLRLLILLSGIAAVAALNALAYRLLGDAFILARNLSIAQEGAFDLGEVGASNYLIRLFGNSTNLAFRPVFLDISGGVPLVSLAYWISGISCLVCLAYAGRSLWSRNANRYSSWLALLFVVSLVVISLNPLVQPRYQLFFVVIMLHDIISNYPLKDILCTYAAAIVLSLLAGAAYIVTGIGLPAPYEWGRPMVMG